MIYIVGTNVFWDGQLSVLPYNTKQKKVSSFIGKTLFIIIIN